MGCGVWVMGLPRAPRAVWVALVLLCAVGCTRAPSKSEVELRVFAASSLREGFEALGREFEREPQGRAEGRVRVAFNFAGTQELRTQLEHGALADAFAAADERHMAAVREASLVDEPQVFARNEPVIVLGRGTPRVQGLADLPALDRIVVGANEVPIGRYTAAIVERASEHLGSDFPERFAAKVVSRELNVKQVLAKVVLGEAEAGIVYRTDARASEGVRVVPIAPEYNVVASYPVAVTRHTAHPELARAWVNFVLSPRGQALLESFGFSSPGGGS